MRALVIGGSVVKNTAVISNWSLATVVISDWLLGAVVVSDWLFEILAYVTHNFTHWWWGE